MSTADGMIDGRMVLMPSGLRLPEALAQQGSGDAGVFTGGGGVSAFFDGQEIGPIQLDPLANRMGDSSLDLKDYSAASNFRQSAGKWSQGLVLDQNTLYGVNNTALSHLENCTFAGRFDWDGGDGRNGLAGTPLGVYECLSFGETGPGGLNLIVGLQAVDESRNLYSWFLFHGDPGTSAPTFNFIGPPQEVRAGPHRVAIIRDDRFPGFGGSTATPKFTLWVNGQFIADELPLTHSVADRPEFTRFNIGRGIVSGADHSWLGAVYSLHIWDEIKSIGLVQAVLSDTGIDKAEGSELAFYDFQSVGVGTSLKFYGETVQTDAAGNWSIDLSGTGISQIIRVSADIHGTPLAEAAALAKTLPTLSGKAELLAGGPASNRSVELTLICI